MKLSFEEIKDEILKSGAKAEYKQACIVILRNIFNKTSPFKSKPDNTISSFKPPQNKIELMSD